MLVRVIVKAPGAQLYQQSFPSVKLVNSEKDLNRSLYSIALDLCLAA